MENLGIFRLVPSDGDYSKELVIYEIRNSTSTIFNITTHNINEVDMFVETDVMRFSWVSPGDPVPHFFQEIEREKSSWRVNDKVDAYMIQVNTVN